MLSDEAALTEHTLYQNCTFANIHYLSHYFIYFVHVLHICKHSLSFTYIVYCTYFLHSLVDWLTWAWQWPSQGYTADLAVCFWPGCGIGLLRVQFASHDMFHICWTFSAFQAVLFKPYNLTLGQCDIFTMCCLMIRLFLVLAVWHFDVCCISFKPFRTCRIFHIFQMYPTVRTFHMFPAFDIRVTFYALRACHTSSRVKLLLVLHTYMCCTSCTSHIFHVF